MDKVKSFNYLGGGAVGQSIDPASGGLGVRVPAATNLTSKNM